MTGMHALTSISLRSARLLLPWSAALLVSVVLAYATIVAIAGSWAMSGGSADSSFPANSERNATHGLADAESVAKSRSSCPAFSGAYGWLLYEMERGAVCATAIAVESNTSPDP